MSGLWVVIVDFDPFFFVPDLEYIGYCHKYDKRQCKTQSLVGF